MEQKLRLWQSLGSKENTCQITVVCQLDFFFRFVRDHSYITSALVGGEGGLENANFCLFLVLKTC